MNVYCVQLQEIMDSMKGNYSQLQKKLARNYPDILGDILKTWPYNDGSFMEKCYFYINSVSPVCEYGNRKKFTYYNTGYVSCSKNCKCRLDKYCETMIKNHGVKHPLQNAALKEKAFNTLETKYGTRKLSEVNIEKKRQTNRDRYGANSPLESKEIHLKTKTTLFERTGYHTNFENPVIQKNIQDSWSDKNINNQRSFVRDSDSLTAQNILYRKNNFVNDYNKLYNADDLTDLLRVHSRVEVAQMFNCSVSLIDKQINLFNLTEFQNSSSYYETLIANLLSDNNVTFEKNTRKIIPPKELDFYCPDHRLAIEFCGLRWHGEYHGRGKTYHLNKLTACNKLNISLIQIFQDEWDNNSTIVKNIILSKLGKYQQVYYARQTTCKVISSFEASQFLNENHLQGAGVTAKYNYGLFYDNQLISVMTFSVNYFHKIPVYELKRFVTKIGTRIKGGASKLFAKFREDISPAQAISYCDLRYFSGEVYSSLGFTKIKTTHPGYWYVKGVKRYHRLHFTKNKLIKENFDKSKTEYQIMQERGFDRIWDCGHSKWEWVSS